jgi:hypothetical protein
MLVSRIDIEGRMCRDMYDEHPGFAYFYVDSHRSVPVRKPLTLALAQATAELAWQRLSADESADTEDFEEHDGDFSPNRIVLRGRDGTVMQSFENGHWVSEFDAPEEWAALLTQARELESEASIEAGWDNFSTAENLRHRATALRRRVTISQAHFGVLAEPPPVPFPRPVRRMRGLDVRTAFALGKILRISTPAEGEDAMSEAAMDAEALGMRDHHQGLTEPPVMFADEPQLETAWRIGYAFAARDTDSEGDPDWLD